ncbi:MAG: hypothetical protein M1830_003565 [Pleopsidium flavum]|nr:MAG: hypothetical protein M1830_003565 [Pleopsidium flavum]
MGALSEAKARNPLVVAIILITLATTAVIVRLLLRKKKKIAFAADDYSMMLELFFKYGLLGLEIASMSSNGALWAAAFLIRVGVGRYTADVTPPQVVIALKIMLPIETLYGMSMSTVKCSILLFFLRIFVTRSFRVAARVCMVISVCWGMSVILEGFLLCRPLALNWDPTIKATCGDRHSAFVAAGALNMATVIMVLLLPIPTV